MVRLGHDSCSRKDIFYLAVGILCASVLCILTVINRLRSMFNVDWHYRQHETPVGRRNWNCVHPKNLTRISLHSLTRERPLPFQEKLPSSSRPFDINAPRYCSAAPSASRRLSNNTKPQIATCIIPTIKESQTISVPNPKRHRGAPRLGLTTNPSASPHWFTAWFKRPAAACRVAVTGGRRTESDISLVGSWLSSAWSPRMAPALCLFGAAGSDGVEMRVYF